MVLGYMFIILYLLLFIIIIIIYHYFFSQNVLYGPSFRKIFIKGC
jgi:hypothetical protein